MSFRKRRPDVTTATRLLFNGQRHKILASLALKPQLANSICFPGYCVFFCDEISQHIDAVTTTG